MTFKGNEAMKRGGQVTVESNFLISMLLSAHGTRFSISFMRNLSLYFHQIGTLGRFGLEVAMSAGCLSVVVPFPCNFLAWTESAFLRGPSLFFGADWWS